MSSGQDQAMATVTCRENFVKFGHVFFEARKQRDIQTCMLIAILCTPPPRAERGGRVTSCKYSTVDPSAVSLPLSENMQLVNESFFNVQNLFRICISSAIPFQFSIKFVNFPDICKKTKVSFSPNTAYTHLDCTAMLHT